MCCCEVHFVTDAGWVDAGLVMAGLLAQHLINLA